MKSGQCLCGEIKFEVHGKERWTGVCHCKMCQRLSGGGFQVWVQFEQKELKILTGKPKDFSSSSRVVRSACPNCSSHLFFRYTDSATDLYITAPSLDGSEVQPEQHIWWKSKMNWLCLDDNITKREE